MSLEKYEKVLDDKLSKPTEGASVSSVSASDKGFESLNLWLGKLKTLQGKATKVGKPLSEGLTKLTEDNTQDDIEHPDPAPAIEPLHTEGGSPATWGVYEYKLTDSPSWLVLLAPGFDLNNARRTLETQFGEDRLVEVRPKHSSCGQDGAGRH